MKNPKFKIKNPNNVFLLINKFHVGVWRFGFGILFVICYLSFVISTDALAKPVETGILQIFSEEEDVYIYLDGYMKGKNSVTKDGIQVGKHYIKALKGKKDGPMIFSMVVKVNKGEVETIVIPAVKPAISQPPAAITPPLALTAIATQAVTSTASTTASATVSASVLILQPDLPFKIIEITPELAKEKGLDVITGVMVEDSKLDAVKPGDIILSFADAPITSSDAYRRYLAITKIGEKVVLEILRKDKSREKISVEVIGLLPPPMAETKTPSPEITKP